MLRDLALFLLMAAPVGAVPALSGNALDGHPVVLPRDLGAHATVFILGFSKDSADTTTAWEVPVRTRLSGDGVQFYDLPCIEDAPGFIRGMIVSSIRKKVPEVARPHFVPLSSGTAAWKQAAQYDKAAPDAAYVMVVDHNGQIMWQTHQPYSQKLFDEMAAAAKKL